jgi:hypothetical protein
MNVQVPIDPAESVALQFTVVVPTGKNEPEDGEHDTVAPAQLSFTDGLLYVTTAPHLFGSLLRAMFAGQVIVGAGLLAVVVAIELLLLESGSVEPAMTDAVFVIVVLLATEQSTVALRVIVAAGTPTGSVAKLTVRLLPEPPHTPPAVE